MTKTTSSISIIISTIIILIFSVGASSASPRTEELDSLGSAEGKSSDTASLVAEIHEAKRDSTGALLSVTWSVENLGDSPKALIFLRDRDYSYSEHNYAGVTVRNDDTDTRFHPVMDGSGNCLCSGPTSNDLAQQIAPGQKVAYWSLYSVPANADSIVVELPGFTPIEDIPIS